MGGPTRGVSCNLSFCVQKGYPPNVMHPLPLRWKGRDGKQAKHEFQGTRELAVLGEDQGADSDETRNLVAPEIFKYFSLTRTLGCEFICDEVAAGPVPQGPSSLRVAQGAIAETASEGGHTSPLAAHSGP